MITLRPYQAAPALAILNAVLNEQGGAFTVMMARQSGKNETSAWIERFLLHAFETKPRTGVKAAPTLRPQAYISRQRLLKHLGDSRSAYSQDGHYVYRVKARWAFLSAEPGANVVGHTADILLEADEAQDINPDKWDKDFRPMAAVADTPVVYWGTAWSDDTLLAQAIASNPPSHNFAVPWTTVAEHNPRYARYVAAERDRLGANHPLFLTQYELQTLPGAGRLLSPAQLVSLLSGSHDRQEAPSPHITYVAGIDVAGEDTARQLRGRDSTVITIGAVTFPAPKLPPTCQIVTAYAFTGTAHSELYPIIARTLRAWGVHRVAVDATALGEALALYLRPELGEQKVIAHRMTELTKSNLGYALQAAATTGRLTIWRNDQSGDYHYIVHQLTHCRAEYRPNRTVRWSVPESEGHDDYAVSIALCNHAAEQCPPPAIARGTAPTNP